MKKLVLLFITALLCLQVYAQQKAVPPAGKTLMFIGQDLKSVFDYTQSGKFPTPSGVVSYNPLPERLGLWTDYDWGAGPINTLSAAQGYPQSLLSIGVYLKEDQWQPNRLADIANGIFDAELGEFGWFIGNRCKYLNAQGDSVPYPVYIRLGYEFDGHWNAYDPQKYVSAYQHIVDIVRPLAPNAIFVWQSSSSPIDEILDEQFGDPNESIQSWYPGDNYVDWVGISWFLSQDPVQKTEADEVLNFARQKGLPVMICESTPQGYDLKEKTKKYISYVYDGEAGTGQVAKSSQQIWNEWFEPYFDYIYNNSDVIRATCYINADWDAQFLWSEDNTSQYSPNGYAEGYWGDTRIEEDSYISQKWNEEMAKSIWLHGSSSIFDQVSDGTSQPPSNVINVSFDQPSTSQFNLGSSVSVVINASATAGVSQVTLAVDNNNVGTDNAAPYTWSLTNLGVGSHTLVATVTDGENDTKQATKTITIIDNTTPPINVGGGFFPEDGKTLTLIGQTYQQEYIDYVSGIGTAPAGSSHYGTFFYGTFEQGDDGGPNTTPLQFMDYVDDTYPGSYALCALALKDNPRAGGYGSLNPNDSDFTPNAAYNACVDITNGLWDDEIDNYANIFKARPEMKYFLRIGYEVSMGMMANKSTTSWEDILANYADQGLNILEDPSLASELDTEAFKNAYNYIAHRIREINQVENVVFVYHPVRGVGDAKGLYPGNQYVDYFALSVFNHDICFPTYEPQEGGDLNVVVNCESPETLDSNVEQVFDWAQNTLNKPLMIAESTPQTNADFQGADFQVEYLQRITNLIDQYDIKVWAYINSNWVSHNWPPHWGDTRVEVTPTVKQFWLNNVVNSNRYIHYGVVPQDNIQVSITSPTNNASFTAPASIQISANATDDVSVSSVKFELKSGNTVLSSTVDVALPYNATFTNVEAGSYTLVATATDNEGNTDTESVDSGDYK